METHAFWSLGDCSLVFLLVSVFLILHTLICLVLHARAVFDISVEHLQAFESPDTLNSCASFLRQYIVDSSSSAACLVVAKKSIAFPQVGSPSVLIPVMSL